MQGLIGRKVGMTQVFGEDGAQIPVTVIEAGPCVVVQRKTSQRDGYDAVQLGFGEQKAHRVNKPQLKRYEKLSVTPCKHLHEFRVDAADEATDGTPVTVGILAEATYVDITGTSKGRGFQGAIRRHNMSRGPMSHGGHSKRRTGSIGQCSYPSRVWKGKKMPGQYGAVRVTQQNLKVVQVREDDNLLLVRGAIPGANGSIVYVSKAIKKG